MALGGQGSVSVSLDAVARMLQQRIAEDAMTIAMLHARIGELESQAAATPVQPVSEEPK